MLSIALELMVVCLLFVTILHCIILQRQLSKLKDEGEGLGAAVNELNLATNRAEQALKDLQRQAQSAQQELGEHIAMGEEISILLDGQVKRASKLTKLFDKEHRRAPSVAPKFELSRERLDRAQALRARRPGFDIDGGSYENEQMDQAANLRRGR